MISSKMTEPVRRMAMLALAAATLWQTAGVAQLKRQNYDKSTKFFGLTVLLGAQGPYVKTVNIASKPVLLTVINRSGLRDLHVSLTKDVALRSAAAADVAMELIGTNHKDGAHDQSKLIDLEPGVYYLTVREKLTWSVRVVVTP